MGVCAQDWQLVADTNLGQLRLDKASVGKEGQYTTALLAYHFSQSQKVAKPPYEVFDLRTDEVMVDCANPTLGIKERRFYYEAKLVSTYSLKPAEIQFNAPVPDTMAQTVVKAVCDAARK
jgi:hypothetical protein